MEKQFKISDTRIKELYLSGLTLKEVALLAQDNVGLMALRKKLHKLGVDTSRKAAYPRYTLRRSIATRTYSFNEYAFLTIDTQEKAYWLGFLMADGYNHESKNCVTIRLQNEDREHLEKLKKFLSFTGNIRTYHRVTKKNHLERDYCELYLCSPIFCKILSEKGCIQRKTYVLQFPEYLSKNLLPHFLRGYFDGDGCISITRRKNRTPNSKTYQFNIVGMQHVLQKMQEIICENAQVAKTTIAKHKNDKAVTIHWSGYGVVLKILNFLYKDATIYLQRKYEKYMYMVTRQSNLQ